MSIVTYHLVQSEKRDRSIKAGSVYNQLNVIYKDASLKDPVIAGGEWQPFFYIYTDYPENNGQELAYFTSFSPQFYNPGIYITSEGTQIRGTIIKVPLLSKETFILGQKWKEFKMVYRKKKDSCLYPDGYEPFKLGVNCWSYELGVYNIMDTTDKNLILVEGYLEVRQTLRPQNIIDRQKQGN